MRTPSFAAPRTTTPRTSTARTGSPSTDADDSSRPLWLWRGAGPALTPRGLVPLHIEGAAPAVQTPSGPGLRIERGTTNYVTNPSFEVDLTGWTTLGSPTVTRETGDAAFGAAYARVTTTGAGDGIRFTGTGNATQGQTYTASVHLRAATPSDVGKKVQFYLDAPGGTYEISAVDHTLTASWTRVTVTKTWANAGHTGWALTCRDGIGQGGFAFELDAVQYELGNASTYGDGSLGDGFEWTSTPNASSSTRSGTRVVSLLPALRAGAAAVAFRPDWPTIDSNAHVVLEVGTSPMGSMRLVGSDGEWSAEIVVGDETQTVAIPQAHVASDLVRLAASWSGGTLSISTGDHTASAPLSVRPIAHSSVSMGRASDLAGNELAGVIHRTVILAGHADVAMLVRSMMNL